MKNNKIKSNALSLFNGMGFAAMGFAAMACDELGLKFDNFYISEIDKHANKAAMALYPDSIQLGDVTKWREWNVDWANIDLLLGGSPCQGFSFAGKQAGTKAVLDDVEYLVTDRQVYLDLKEKGADFLSQSHLFWEFVLCLDFIKLANPKVKFMFENVWMKKELLEMITRALSVDHVCINSALVSAQNRVRYYWTNIAEIDQPEDIGVKLIDILECNISIDKWKHTQSAIDYMNRKVKGGRTHWDFKHHSDSESDKSQCVTANFHKGVPYNILVDRRKSRAIKCTESTGNNPQQYYDKRKKNLVFAMPEVSKLNKIDDIKSDARKTRGDEVRKDGKSNCLLADGHQSRWLAKGENDIFYRKLTPTECLRLQTVPVHHINTLLNCGISNTQLYKIVGNGWTHDVIVHILKGLSNEY